MGTYDPQLATLVTVPPSGSNWIIEPKFDGYRLGAIREKAGVTLKTRNGNDWTDKFPGLSKELEEIIPRGTVLDGEVIAASPSQPGGFQILQSYFKSPKGVSLHYYVFDLLFENGKDVRKLPLETRRALLRQVLPAKHKHIHQVPPLKGQPIAALNKSKKDGLEGIILKDPNSPYRAGRSGTWLKMKLQSHEEFAILGYTLHSKQTALIGSLLLALNVKKDSWLYCGKVGTGFTNAVRADLFKTLQKSKSTNINVVNPKNVPRSAVLVKPTLGCEISFTEWTSDNMLRHPSFLGIREDKNACEIRIAGSSLPSKNHRQESGKSS